MIRLRFQFMCLVSPEPATAAVPGVRVAFPWGGHALGLYYNGTAIGTGRRISLVVQNAAGVSVNLGVPGGLPLGEPVMSLGNVDPAMTPYQMLPTDSLLNQNLAQTVLFLHGGTFSADTANYGGKYSFARWQIGNASQTLTDTIDWELATDPNFSYFLQIDQQPRLELISGARVLLSNKDYPQGPGSEPGEIVELEEVDNLYNMVTPQPPQRPRPRTTVIPQPVPPPTVVGVWGGRTVTATAASPIPDLPLCPVGETP